MWSQKFPILTYLHSQDVIPSFLFLMVLGLEGEINIWDRKGAP